MDKALICGISGQDGAYLSRLLLEKGYEVHGTDRPDIPVDITNLQILGIDSEIEYHSLDLSNYEAILKTVDRIMPDEVYNLAAISSVGKSFEFPILTAEINGLSSLKILECLRRTNSNTKFFQASSSEMYGIPLTAPQSELTEFYPKSPYASAKLFAHHSVINYREAYDLFACSGIMYNHESPLRGVEFVTRKITNSLARIKYDLQEKLVLGNLSVKRDFGYAKEYVEAMWLILQQKEADDFVVATGETHSIREFTEVAAEYLGYTIEWEESGSSEKGVDKKSGKILVEVSSEFFRPTEVGNIIGDASKAARKLNWAPKVNFEKLVKIMVDADIDLVQKSLTAK
jgi:GDPmannose 4,6-dehydratase